MAEPEGGCMAEGRAALRSGRDVLARKALGQRDEFLKEADLL